MGSANPIQIHCRRFVPLILLVSAASPTVAADPPAADDLTIDIDVTAHRLDAARQQIQPALGSSVYGFSPTALDAIPQGAAAPLNQVLLQAPGVAQDSFGQIHLRGEHADVQYRLNGVALPEGLSVFGQAIEGRFANSLSLITGALPAQYGFQTAGVVDIQTKNGTDNPGCEVGMYGGRWSWLQPSVSCGGRSGPVDYFFTGDFLHNDIGIENPTAHDGAIHDTTNQAHGLAYVSAIINPDTRISLILGAFDGQFQIPNNPGQVPGYNVGNNAAFDSSRLNETQREATDFAILSLQQHLGSVDLQTALFSRYSSLRFSPDWIGDLMFNGIAQQASRTDTAYGIQSDAGWQYDDRHTIRFGVLLQQETTGADMLSRVLPVDASGTQTTSTPQTIFENATNWGGLYGVYVQDEWRILPTVTINGGLRFDTVQQFTAESQVSPRLNVVWKATPDTTVHVGYSRYFAPPPFELVGGSSLLRFANTTALPPGSVTADRTVRAERSNYFDAGVSQVVVPGLIVGVDAYDKQSQNLIDEGQFGAPIILTAFNYAHGLVQGVEFTANYDRGPWSLYGNAAYSRAMGKGIDSAQFNFSAAELAYIGNNWIHLDHDQTWTGSAGAAYIFNGDTDHPTRISANLIVQSGLRASTATIPNGIALPAYGVVNLSVMQALQGGTTLRLDLLNVGDTVYEIRDGTGVGVGAPQFGLRRTILAGVTQRF